MTTSASYQSHLIETDIELQCLYNQAFSGTLENYSVVIPNVTKHEANRTFIRDVFDFYALGEVTSVQYLETNIGNHETRIHFRPYETQQMNKLLELHSDNMYYTLKLNKYNPENHEMWQIFSLPPDSVTPIQESKPKTKEVIMLENKINELRQAVEMIPELVSTLGSLNARIKYLEDPEWLDDICQPLSMEDLSTSSDTMDVEIDRREFGTQPISTDDLCDVDVMDTDSDSLAEIWPMPFNPS
tara:strand:+ start:24351 stop:25079 length:729 start_codon:yes stop_codon:yes gene_type:complete